MPERRTGRTVRCLARGALMVGVLAPSLAGADATTSNAVSPPVDELQEVVVTAQRREENLQRVPVAVTSLSSEELRARQLSDQMSLQHAVPSLAIWPALGNSATATVSIRGQVEHDLLPTYDAAVGTYLDGVYVSRATGANMDLVDMDRVEVLRGPQGTLFGRNTTGGAISLITQKPVNRFESSLAAKIGNYDSVELTGVLNLPIAALDGAWRTAVMHSGHSGYGRSTLLGRDLQDDDTNYLRTQLRLPLGDPWTLNVSLDATQVRTASQLQILVAAFPPADQVPAAAGNPTDSLSNYENVVDGNVRANRVGSFDMRVWGASATLSRPLPEGSVSSITAYRTLEVDVRNTDQDGTPYDLGATIARTQREWQFSQELQVHTLLARGRLEWVAGLLYFAESANLHGHGIALAPLNTNENLLRGTANNEAAAAYLDVTDTVAPTVRLHAGIRYNVDWRQLVSQNAAIIGGVETCELDASVVDGPGLCQATLPRKQFSYAPWSVGIDYLPAENGLLYAKISRGYRAGGYNMRGTTNVSMTSFGPENVISYEVGAKADLLRRRLRLDLALYYADYREVQLGLVVPDPIGDFSFVKQNGGRARIQGGELEVTALLGGMRVAGGVGVTDGKYLSLSTYAVGLTDNSAIGLPRLTYSFSGDLPVHTPLGETRLHADYSYHSNDIDSGFRARCSCNNEYAILNAIVTLELSSRLELGLWGRNLTQTYYMAQSLDGGSFINAVPGDPRTYGISITYRLGPTTATE